MAKFYGKIGFETDESWEEEVRPSTYFSTIIERSYVGDILKVNIKNSAAERPSDDFSINNEISILADPIAMHHFTSMKYVEFMGVLWEVRGVTVEYPRLRISFGGIYHGATPET